MADTINEFLVSIGYEVKETTIRDAEKAFEDIDKLVKRAAIAFAGLAASLTAVVAKTTVQLDSLYFAAQRAGTSAENLRSLAYAMEQTGKSGAAAGDIIGGFAAKLRTLPTNEGIIQRLGVQTRQNGVLRDTSEMLLDVVDQLAQDPNYARAASNADLLGIKETDLNYLVQNRVKIRAMLAEDKARNVGIGLDPTRATTQSMLLMRGWRALQFQIEVMIETVVFRITPVIVPFIDRLDAWLKENQKAIVEAAGRIIGALVGFSGDLSALLVRLAPVAAEFDKIVKSITGSKGLVVAMEAFGAVFVASVALRMMKAGRGAGLAILGIVTALAIRQHMSSAPVPGAPTGPGTQSPGMQGLSTQQPGQTSFIGRAYQGTKNVVRRALGLPEQKESTPKTTTESGPALDRSTFDEELKNPAVRDRLFAYTHAEVGTQGPDAQKAFMETIFNRAKARGQTLWQTLQGGYFPQITHSRAAEYLGDPNLEKKYAGIFEDVKNGSNISNYATGNQSGTVTSGGAFVSFKSNGEGFVWEKDARDNSWRKKAIAEGKLKKPAKLWKPADKGEWGEKSESEGIDSEWDPSEDEPKPTPPAPAPFPGTAPARIFQNKSVAGPGVTLQIESIERARQAAAKLWKPADKDEWSKRDPLKSSGLQSSPWDDDSSFSISRKTKIVVHADRDPHKTVSAVNRETKRINTDLIDSGQTAVA